MREDDHPNSPWRAWAVVLTVVAALLLAYPLSFGPMFWLCSDSSNRVGHDLKSKTFLVVYHPVIWVMQSGPQPLSGVVSRYFQIWEK